MFLVAVLVLLFLMYRFYTFRAEMVFIMTLLTPAMLLIGAYQNLFIYGALRFLQTFCRMTIVFSFVAAMLGGVSLDYKERLDIAGRKIYVDDNLRDAEGNQYTEVER